jgi:hypothetical protein
VKRIKVQVDKERDGLRAIRFDYGTDAKLANGTHHGSHKGTEQEFWLGDEEFITRVQMKVAGDRVRAISFTFSSCNNNTINRHECIFSFSYRCDGSAAAVIAA